MDDRLFPFRSRFLDVGGRSLHYVDEGQGPVHLFLAGMWSFTFRHAMAALRGRARCVAVDYPGFGLSPAPPGFVPRLPDLAQAVQVFIRHLDLRDVTLWVNDAGGPIGMGVAAREPDRFRGFVIGGTFAWPLRGDPRGVDRMLGLVGGGGFRWFNRQVNLFPRLLGGPALNSRRLSPAERRHYRMPVQPRALRDRPLLLLRSFLDDEAHIAETAARIPALRAKPALLVFGTKDRALHFLDRWKQELPHHTVALLPGVGHFPFEDDPTGVQRAVNAWLPTVQAPLPR